MATNKGNKGKKHFNADFDPIFISAQVSQAQIIWGNVAAATVIQSIPPILLTIFLQKI